ncbi:MAG: division plane positioning ATPase MipZ [Pseudomonadota bacterium]
MDTHIIVLGNEKGGSGKSTVAMHIIIALLRSGYRVGALDLDHRQQSLTRYLTNRQAFVHHMETQLPFPVVRTVTPADHDSRTASQDIELSRFREALESLGDCHFVVIDCPGANTFLSRLAHAHADTIVTPMNDSFVDFDLLGRLDPKTGDVLEPSLYSEIVWEARKQRALSGLQQGVDWVVTRNRLSPTKANNQREVGKRLDDLASRIGFRLARGLGERVIYRELFPAGLTLLDLGGKDAPIKLKTMSHLTARLEIRSLIVMLKLPAFDVGKAGNNPSPVAA